MKLHSLITMSFGLMFSLKLFAADPVWDANEIQLKLQPLGEGVYAVYDERADKTQSKGVPLATSAGIIVGSDSVMLVDTMMTKRLHLQLMYLVRSVTDKPVKYAVNTSFHGDHSYGNYLLNDDVTIIQHANTQAYIHSHFEADKTFMVNTFGSQRGIEDVTPTKADILIPQGGELTVDLGNRSVLIKDFGFAQTGGDLFVWLQHEKVIWTGNPIVAEAPALPWLLDGHLIETLETLQAVYDFLPKDSVVIPGHSLPSTKRAIKWNIDYLIEVKKQVGQAVSLGLSLEKAIESIPMKEYQGYALFDWVHPGLNIPAAYKDLSK